MSESDSDNFEMEVEREAELALNGLLPSKSKKIYENAFKQFMAWFDNKKLKVISEKVLLVYFTKEYQTKKPSTTWTHYSMLRTTLNVKKNVDIGKFSQLKALLKRKSDGYKAKKSRIFKKEDIEKFLTSADDLDYLAMKVSLVNLVVYSVQLLRESHDFFLFHSIVDRLGVWNFRSLPSRRTYPHASCKC